MARSPTATVPSPTEKARYLICFQVERSAHESCGTGQLIFIPQVGQLNGAIRAESSFRVNYGMLSGCLGWLSW
ncbi:hypothetical protein MHYP_G00049590 [Metynnis hypsauchen]